MGWEMDWNLNNILSFNAANSGEIELVFERMFVGRKKERVI